MCSVVTGRFVRWHLNIHGTDCGRCWSFTRNRARRSSVFCLTSCCVSYPKPYRMPCTTSCRPRGSIAQVQAFRWRAGLVARSSATGRAVDMRMAATSYACGTVTGSLVRFTFSVKGKFYPLGDLDSFPTESAREMLGQPHLVVGACSPEESTGRGACSPEVSPGRGTPTPMEPMLSTGHEINTAVAGIAAWTWDRPRLAGGTVLEPPAPALRRSIAPPLQEFEIGSVASGDESAVGEHLEQQVQWRWIDGRCWRVEPCGEWRVADSSLDKPPCSPDANNMLQAEFFVPHIGIGESVDALLGQLYIQLEGLGIDVVRCIPWRRAVVQLPTPAPLATDMPLPFGSSAQALPQEVCEQAATSEGLCVDTHHFWCLLRLRLCGPAAALHDLRRGATSVVLQQPGSSSRPTRLAFERPRQRATKANAPGRGKDVDRGKGQERNSPAVTSSLCEPSGSPLADHGCTPQASPSVASLPDSPDS
mmetsp:Transcript_18734/g.51468  ORF Transcript_18734/g.51468 Transcript_18734/m.51468 type:complete len:476 (-) Transcript_18734:151-1578(-)